MGRKSRVDTTVSLLGIATAGFVGSVLSNVIYRFFKAYRESRTPDGSKPNFSSSPFPVYTVEHFQRPITINEADFIAQQALSHGKIEEKTNE